MNDERSEPIPDWWPRLSQKVEADGDCRVWTASMAAGYPQLWVDGTNRKVYRLTWELAYGRIPGDRRLENTCGNRACVRPAHWRLAAEDVDQPAANRGDRHPDAELSVIEVMDIRMLRQGGGPPTFRELAERYGVGKTTVIDAAKGRTWSNLPGGTRVLLQ